MQAWVSTFAASASSRSHRLAQPASAPIIWSRPPPRGQRVAKCSYGVVADGQRLQFGGRRRKSYRDAMYSAEGYDPDLKQQFDALMPVLFGADFQVAGAWPVPWAIVPRVAVRYGRTATASSSVAAGEMTGRSHRFAANDLVAIGGTSAPSGRLGPESGLASSQKSSASEERPGLNRSSPVRLGVHLATSVV
jgi:hypothetical protein